MLLISIVAGLAIFLFGVAVGSEFRLKRIEKKADEARKKIYTTLNHISLTLEDIEEGIK